MKKLLKYSRKLDVFGTSIELTLQQQKTHKTFFGAFLTVCVIIACFLGSRQIGSDFIVKQDPDMLYKEMIFEQNIDVYEEWENLDMQFSIQDSLSQAQLNAQQLVQDSTLQIKILYYQSKLEQQELKIEWLDNGMAFRISNENILELVDFKNIVVQVIGQALNYYNLYVSYRQYIFRSDNFSNPFYYITKNYSYSLNNVGIEMIFSHTEISTDRGLITQMFESEYQLILQEKQNVEQKPNDDYNSSKFIISISDVRKYYKRKYLKIQNLLAIIGGLLKSLLVVGKFISKPVAKLSIRSRLLNELFNFAELQAIQQTSSISSDKAPSNPNNDANNETKKDIKNNSLALQVKTEQNENDQMIQKNNESNNIKENKGQKRKPSPIQKKETNYFEDLNLNTEQNNEVLKLNLAKSNVFQIQLQTQIEKNIVSQKSINSKKQMYINSNSKNSNYSFASPGKVSKNFFQGSQIPSQNQIQHPFAHSNQLTPPTYKDNQFRFDYKKQPEIIQDASPKNENTQSKQNFNTPNNTLTLQKKKSFQGKKTNSLKTQEMFLISEVPQEQLELNSKTQQNSSNGKKTSKFFPSPPQLKQIQQDQESKRINQFDRNLLKGESNDKQSQAQSTSLQSRFKRISVEIPQTQANKIAELGNNSNSSNQKQPPQKDKRPSISFEMSGIPSEPKQPTLNYIESLSQINQNTKAPLLEKSLSNTIINMPALINIQSQLDKAPVINYQGDITSLDKQEEDKNKKNIQDAQVKRDTQTIHLEEQFPVLKKSNTQFVADLIQERAKTKTKSFKQNELLISQSNNNPSNRVSEKGQVIEHKESIKNRLSDAKNNGSEEINRSMTQRELKKFDKMIENKQTNSLKLGFLDYIKYFIFKKDKKKTQINYCMKKVKQRVDIVYILNKLVEIDKLKMLFLDHNQRELFEFLPRPVVLQKKNQDINEVNDKYNIQEAWSLLQEEKNTIDKATDACISYKIMAQKKKKNVLDDRLLEMLDINIRHVFDQTAIPNEIIEEKRGISQIHTNLHNRQNQLFNMHEKKIGNKEQILSQPPQLLQRNISNKSQKTQKSNINKKKMYAQKPTDDVFNAYESYQPSGTQNMSGQDTPLSLRDGFNKKQSYQSNNDPRQNRLKDLLALQNHPKNLRKPSEKHLSNHSRKMNSQDYLSDINSTESNQKAKQPYNNNEIKHKNFSTFQQNFIQSHSRNNSQRNQANLLQADIPTQKQTSNFSFQQQQNIDHQNFAQISLSSQQKMSMQSNQMTQQDSTVTPYIGQNTNNYQLNIPQQISHREKSPIKNKSRDSIHSIPESVPEESNQSHKKYVLPNSQITTKLQNLPQQILQMQIQTYNKESYKQAQLSKLDDILQKNNSLIVQQISSQENENISDSLKAQYKQKVKDNNYHSKTDVYNINKFLVTDHSSDEGDLENGLNNVSSSTHKISKRQIDSNHSLFNRRKANTLSKSLDISRSDSSNNSLKQQNNQPISNLLLKDNMNLKYYYQIAKPIKHSIFNQQ